MSSSTIQTAPDPTVHTGGQTLRITHLMRQKTRTCNSTLPSQRFLALVAVVVSMALGIPGCGKDPEIRRYSVAKTEQAPAVAKEERMLAAIVPHGRQTWFFKLSGPNEPVNALKTEFDTFLDSIIFSADDRPAWRLPQGWQEQPAQGMRFATLLIGDTSPTLELTVIPLPTPDIDADKAALDNVNRWRGQLGLPSISAAEFRDQAATSGELSRRKLSDGTEAVVVNLLGERTGGTMQPPFAGSGGGNPAGPKQASASKLSYEVPAGWNEIAAEGMRQAAFAVQDGEQQAEVTVISMPGQAGGPLENINRWRRQIGLPAATKPEESGVVQQVFIDGIEGLLIELIGPESETKHETILGAMTFHAGNTWFIKLRGNSELAAREKSNFEKFVLSVKLPKTDGVEGGR